MSTQRQPKPTERVQELSDDAVAQFLQAHPDFFEQHAELLARLRLPHRPGGAAVSLIERQVSILRQRNGKLDRKLRELLSVARSNERLALKIHALSLRLLGATELPELLDVLEQTLRQDFGADRLILVLFDDEGSDDLSEPGFLRRVDRASAQMKPFATFISGGRPRCGQVRESQREFLFGDEAPAIGSSALIPLGKPADLGILAIGNRDSGHFHPAMSTDFLVRISELVSAAVARVLR